jgi:hypothetical protein
VAACALVVSQVVVGAGKAGEAGWMRPHRLGRRSGGGCLRQKRNGTCPALAILHQVVLFAQAGFVGQRQIGQALFGQ